jgi:hypothetical protein
VEVVMPDFFFLAVTLLLFLAAIGYVRWCDRA